MKPNESRRGTQGVADLIRADEQGRPIIDAALSTLVTRLAQTVPEALGHLDATRILFVAGAARRQSKASIRPLTYGGLPPSRQRGEHRKPRVVIGGFDILYEVCLRPLFFLEAAPDERLSIIVHELWHISPGFDGTLDETRRHSGENDRFDAEIGALVMRYLSVDAHGAHEVLSRRGEIRMSAWLRRPPSRIPLASEMRDSYTEADLHSSIIFQR